MKSSEVDHRYVREFQERLASRPDVVVSADRPGREYLYRPGELLVRVEDRDRVEEQLRGVVEVRDSSVDEFAATAVLRWDQEELDVPAVLETLREPARWDDGEAPLLLPHHVVIGFGNVMGHPTAPPAAAQPLADPAVGAFGAAGEGVTVGVCDTGIWEHAAAAHPRWLGGAYVQQPDDVDALLGIDGVLDLQAGHGTFVAGVLRQAAPGARFDPEVALDPLGVGDLLSVTRALEGLEKGVRVVNLSLGCRTEDNVPPAPLARALARLPREVVVVAAAGNSGDARPTWPAAFKRVIAVAAVEETGRGLRPAPYSNRGPWVDACAVGSRTSTYVEGTTSRGEVFTGWADWAGTSFAAPHVAGRIAAGTVPEDGTSAWPSARRLLGRDPWHPDFGVLVD